MEFWLHPMCWFPVNSSYRTHLTSPTSPISRSSRLQRTQHQHVPEHHLTFTALPSIQSDLIGFKSGRRGAAAAKRLGSDASSRWHEAPLPPALISKALSYGVTLSLISWGVFFNPRLPFLFWKTKKCDSRMSEMEAVGLLFPVDATSCSFRCWIVFSFCQDDLSRLQFYWKGRRHDAISIWRLFVD